MLSTNLLTYHIQLMQTQKSHLAALFLLLSSLKLCHHFSVTSHLPLVFGFMPVKTMSNVKCSSQKIKTMKFKISIPKNISNAKHIQLMQTQKSHFIHLTTTLL